MGGLAYRPTAYSLGLGLQPKLKLRFSLVFSPALIMIGRLSSSAGLKPRKDESLTYPKASIGLKPNTRLGLKA